MYGDVQPIQLNRKHIG